MNGCCWRVCGDRKAIEIHEIPIQKSSNSPSERVKQRHDFRSPQLERLSLRLLDHIEVVGGQVELEVAREQNLQRRSHPLCLQFAPQPTLVTANAVHDPRDVQELLSELELEFVGVAVEHDALVEVRRERLDDVHHILHG